MNISNTSLKTSSQLRKAFLDYFVKHQHTLVPSSSLVPNNDPTLLFTNAGMVQFKDVFLGFDKRPYVRATSSQRCVRAGGKHNDLENVGHTARHHTFFEMLGNFSFGDYFKKEAIYFAWEFLTKELRIPTERLWITVFEEDDEAADIWLKEVKVDPARFSRCSAKDNFWAMGDTGPCGPSTEIFYDHGSDIPGGPPGSPEADADRYIEIWNLVFMQYERSASGALTPLPKPSVDTGMGLERLAAVMQGVHNNYETDLFIPLIEEAGKLANVSDHTNASLRVIADHIRSTSFLIIDGVFPSNEGRGYVLRRIIRRAVRHGYKLGLTQPFFFKLVQPLVGVMGEAYPELTKAQNMVEKILQQEEEQFARTLEQGLKILEQDLAQITSHIIPGTTLFKLYDTYGFPVDLTADIARERDLLIDHAGFEVEMEKQRQASQAASKFGVAYREQLNVDTNTDFTGYELIEDKSNIMTLFREGKIVTELHEGENGDIVLDHSPFYAEGGGQIGDRGLIVSKGSHFEVLDTQKEGQVHLHRGRVLKGVFHVNDVVVAQVDKKRRQATRLNHSATHLLHAALRKLLGEHVTQKGSLVEPERLRFDFTHFEPMKSEEIKTVERLVNEQIRANHTAVTEVMQPDQAIAKGAMALFGEKYGNEVRVLHMGEFSVEVCGGTHVQRTGDIGLFKIISETGIASGVRRIEAVTGEAALNWVDALNDQMQHITQLVKINREALPEKIKQIVDKNKALEKEAEQLRSKVATSTGKDLASEAREIAGIKVVVAQLPTAEMKVLRDTVDQLKNKFGTNAVIVLAGKSEGIVNIAVGMTKDCTDKLHAGELATSIAAQVGGKGGGRADMAQGGGNQPEKLESALNSAYEFIENKMRINKKPEGPMINQCRTPTAGK